MLHEEIKNGIKEAMMARDILRLKAFRAMSAAFTNELVAKNRKPQETLKDEEAIVVIGKLAKQRKDSIEQFKKGNREDLVKEEEAELAILETYLPKMMDRSEVEKLVKSKKEELGITAKELIYLGKILPLTSLVEITNHLFLAKGLIFSNAKPEETEVIKLLKVSMKEAVKMVFSGRICDGTTVALILKAKKHLGYKD